MPTLGGGDAWCNGKDIRVDTMDFNPLLSIINIGTKPGMKKLFKTDFIQNVQETQVINIIESFCKISVNYVNLGMGIHVLNAGPLSKQFQSIAIDLRD